MRLSGKHEVAVLEQAIRLVIARHEILRTAFRVNDDKELRQYIIREGESDFGIDYQDYRNEKNSEGTAAAYMKALDNLPFDLEEGTLIRASMLQLKEDEYIFYCILHHIISDAWSIPVLKQEILANYEALTAGNTPQQAPLEIQYKDYASWHTRNLKNGGFSQQKDYWTGVFSDEVPVLELPLKNTRPAIKTYNGQTLQTWLGSTTTKKIHDYQQERGGSLFMVMLSTFYVMLSKYSGSDDLVVGSPFSAREHAALKSQLGFYTNTLALRSQLLKEDTFDSFFARVKESVLHAYKHQQYPFDQLVRDLDLKKDLSRNPLFDTMLVVLPHDPTTGTEIDNVTGEQDIIREKGTTSKFDLLVYIHESAGNLSLKVEYNTDLFEESLIRQFIGHYRDMIDLLLTHPQKNIGSITYLPETDTCIKGITPASYTSGAVMSLFEKQAAATPDALAVCFEEVALSYKEVNDRANQLATLLREKHSEITRTNIGVLLGRSHYNVVAMLGVMKSGACYVPIDTEYQESRKKYIIKDAGIATMLTTSDIWEEGSIEDIDVLHLDSLENRSSPVENPDHINSPENSAFIIYTSGSTGNPKGVIQTHRMLSNLIQWNMHDSGISTGLKHLQYNSFNFDVSLQDCWFTLSGGGTIYITPATMKIDFERLSQYIIEQGIQVLSFPFSALSGFFKYLDEDFYAGHSLEYIISSGEQLVIEKPLEELLMKFPEVNLHNHYGPSETHVVTSYTLSAAQGKLPKYVPIGSPVANTTLYVLDSHMQPVPDKVIGELYAGGDNLALGYVNLPHLTEERFIQNPFSEGERLYKTGDLVYKSDGVLSYVGRNDDQVKIRGYRIEPAEIQHVILAQDNIRQVHVQVTEVNDNKVIAAYIVGKDEVDIQSLKAEISNVLPQYMVPSYIIQLDDLPLTSNGKIDKRKLPAVDQEALIKAPYKAPETQYENELVTIWENILEVPSIGIYDNFFELGGHSLHITRMLYDINKTFAVKLQIKNVFAAQNIHALAELIEDEVDFKEVMSESKAGAETADESENSEVWEI
jgi:amino acid adenylation domain-containing protein